MKKNFFLGSTFLAIISLIFFSNNPLSANNADYYMEVGNKKLREEENFYGARKALLDFDKAIEIDPLHEGSYVSRCYAKYILKEYYSAISDCNMALKISSTTSNRIGAYVNRGISKEQLGDMSGACSDWRQAWYLGDDDSKNWVKQEC